MTNTKDDFKTVLAQARELVKDQLTLSEEAIMDVAKSAPKGISDRLISLFGRKGKRVRSTLLCLVANCGPQIPDKKRVVHACTSVELLHLASLVHDDIIDGTDIRRGQITAHKEWGTQIAVLIGDYVLSQAMSRVIDEREQNIPLIISNAADMLIVGEIMELDHCGDMGLSRVNYNEIIDGKTAALINAAARIGAILAGFDNAMVEECAKMGSHFGIAFQIIDDLLDYGYGSSNMDKAKFTDLSNGLITLPLLYYFEDCSTAERNEMELLVQKAGLDGIPEIIIQKLTEKGAFEKTKAEAQNHLEKALEIVNKLPKSDFTEELIAIFASMSDRGN